MKTLILVRHAKSSWKAPAQDDAARPLNNRGLLDAPEMGRRIAIQAPRPDLIVSSPAVRARTTAELIALEIGIPSSGIMINDRLYCFEAAELLAVIRNFDDACQTILCIAHNPATTDLVNQLCRTRIDNVPTCGVCYLKIEAPRWRDIKHAELTGFDYPKNPSGQY